MRKILAPLLLLPLFLQAESFLSWQKPEEKACHTQAGHHGGHGARKPLQFQVSDYDPNATYEISYISSTLDSKTLEPVDGIVTIPSTGFSNYHALVVTQKSEESVRCSVRYLYRHGRPSKTSPTKLTHLQKSDFEIVPSPLPREHDRYTGSKTYDFELLFKGAAVANTPVTMTTQFGTEIQVRTDKQGRFEVTLPNDFKEVKTGRRANKPCEFLLKAAYTHEGIEYRSTLSMPYHVNPNDYWRSELVGALLILVGLIAGYFMTRRYVNNRRKAK